MNDFWICEDCSSLFFDPFFNVCPFCEGQVVRAEKCTDCGHIGPAWQFWSSCSTKLCHDCQEFTERKFHTVMEQFTKAQKEFMDWRFDGDSFNVI